MAIFNSYVKLPEANSTTSIASIQHGTWNKTRPDLASIASTLGPPGSVHGLGQGWFQITRVKRLFAKLLKARRFCVGCGAEQQTVRQQYWLLFCWVWIRALLCLQNSTIIFNKQNGLNSMSSSFHFWPWPLILTWRKLIEMKRSWKVNEFKSFDLYRCF